MLRKRPCSANDHADARSRSVPQARLATASLTQTLCDHRAVAQIVPDNTLGSESSVVTPQPNSPNNVIKGGAVRGSNLFHSFQEFNVAEGRGTYFFSPADIQNILARVTGSDRSEILGVLGTSGNSSPNLFLINPNGIIFGKNASLDVEGSFAATTANGVLLGNNGIFSASEPAKSNLLSVNPSAFLFNAVAAQGIVNQSINGLQVPNGESLLMLGGNVRLDGGKLYAAGGRVELGGLSAPGTVGLNTDGSSLRLSFPDSLAKADVSLTNEASVDVTAGSGGSIAINSRNLEVSGGSKVRAGIASGLGSVDSLAGDIDINATGTITVAGEGSFIANGVMEEAKGNAGDIHINSRSLLLRDGAKLSSSTWGKGDAGSVSVQAQDSVSLTNGDMFSTVERKAVGRGGDINVMTGTLSLSDGGTLQASSFGRGDAGNVTITASNNISFDGVGSDGVSSGVFSNVEAAEAIGNGGNINLTAKALSLTNDAVLAASTWGKGDAGSVAVQVQDSVSLVDSNILSIVKPNAQGNGGDISIKSGLLSLSDSAQIITSTYGKGDAGNISVQAKDAVRLTGVNNSFTSGVQSNVEYGAVGDGGDININAGSLSITDGAQVQTLVRNANPDHKLAGGGGNAGKVKIDVSDAVTIAGTTNGYPSGVRSNVGTGAIGNGGDINVTTRTLSVTDGGALQASSFGNGNAGDVTITASNNISFDGVGSDGYVSGVFSNVAATAVGNGGDINIQSGSLSLTNGGQITTSTWGQGDAGNVSVQAQDTVSLTNGGIFSAIGPDAKGNGGDININSGSLSLSDRARLSTSTWGIGNAGNIRVNASEFISVNSDSVLQSISGGRGNAGNVDLNAGGAFSLNTSVVTTALQSAPEFSGIHQGGDINIIAGLISLNDSVMYTNTLGQGNAGNVNIDVRDTVSLDKSAILSTVIAGGVGNGGNINVQTRSLSLTNGAGIVTSTWGQGNAGNVLVQAQDLVALSSVYIQSDVGSGAIGNGGDINIIAGSLSITDGAQVQTIVRNANQDDKLAAGRGNAGTVKIDVADAVTIAGVSNNEYQSSSGIRSEVGPGAIGNGGDIDINSWSLFLRDGAKLSSSTYGQGNAGNISVQAQDTVSLTNGDIFSTVQPNAKGNGGNININSWSLFLSDDAQLTTSTWGQGDAGNVSVQAQDTVSLTNGDIFSTVNAGAKGNGGDINVTTGILSLTNGAVLAAGTFGQGDAGNVSVQAQDTVSLTNGDIFSTVEPDAQGNGGDINVTTGTLSVTAGGALQSSSFGNGNAGDVTITASNNISFDGVGSDGYASGVFSNVEAAEAQGNGGNVSVTARSLFLTNGATLSSSTFGKGDAGSVSVQTDDSASLANGYIFSTVEETAEGNSGSINVNAGTLSLSDGAKLSSSTLGTGNAGSVSVQTDDSASLANGYIFSTVEETAKGNGGDINVTTGTLSLTNSGELVASTFGEGDAGNVTITARENVSFDGVSSDGFTSGAFSTVRETAIGNGGDITLTAKSLSLTNGAELSALTIGQGSAGNIFVNLRDTLQADNSRVTTTAAQSSGGAINISANDIRLLGDSNITTNVFSGAGGGGNINLTADSIVAFDDSDILSYARDGQGGNITLDTPAAFGFPNRPASDIDPETLDNNDRVDINASGAVAGVITLPNVSFIQNSLTELPENLINTNALLANSCIARSNQQAGSFIVTGSGVQTRPGDAVAAAYPTGSVRSTANSTSSRQSWQLGEPIVEAQGVYHLGNGRIVLSRACQ